MKITSKFKLNLKTEEVMSEVKRAGRLGMRDLVVSITHDTVQLPPVGSPFDTGHNRRSMTAEVSGMGVPYKEPDSQPERIVNDSKIEGAVYSTSGYGGWLEIGTTRMPARPYIKPALDRHIKELPGNIERHFK